MVLTQTLELQPGAGQYLFIFCIKGGKKPGLAAFEPAEVISSALDAAGSLEAQTDTSQFLQVNGHSTPQSRAFDPPECGPAHARTAGSTTHTPQENRGAPSSRLMGPVGCSGALCLVLATGVPGRASRSVAHVLGSSI